MTALELHYKGINQAEESFNGTLKRTLALILSKFSHRRVIPDEKPLHIQVNLPGDTPNMRNAPMTILKSAGNTAQPLNQMLSPAATQKSASPSHGIKLRQE
jgi:hypothetical protein